MRKWLFSIGWVLLGLLGIGAMLISSGQSEMVARPQISSYGVSGASALADLLRLRGYQIVVDSQPQPTLKKGDVVVAFQLSSPSESADPELIQKSEQSIRDQIKGGGLVFWLPLNPQFEDGSSSALQPQASSRVDGKSRTLNGIRGTISSEDAGQFPILSANSYPTIAAKSDGKGREILYADGIGLTNRFLDRADNAQTFMELLKAYAPNARRVVFTESTFGASQPLGFLETLGPWAQGGWYQLLFLFMIVVVSLNQRFGLPARIRKPQVGGRELVDALTDTMIRARSTELGLDSAYNRADLKVRSIIRMPRDASEGERDRLMPPEILIALKEVKTASTMERVHPEDALDLVVKLEREVDEFAKTRTSVLTRPKGRNR